MMKPQEIDPYNRNNSVRLMHTYVKGAIYKTRMTSCAMSVPSL